MRVRDHAEQPGALALTLDAPLTALIAEDQASSSRIDLPFRTDGSVAVLDYAEIQRALPRRSTRYRLLGSSRADDSVEQPLSLDPGEVPSARWLRYFRHDRTAEPVVAHLSFTEQGELTLSVRNPVYLDHAERRFRYDHHLTSLGITRRTIAFSFSAQFAEKGSFELTRCYFKLHSNSENVEVVASELSQQWEGTTVSAAGSLTLPLHANLVPLRYVLYASVRDRESGRTIELRLDHLSETLYAQLQHSRRAPTIPLGRNRVLTLATTPKSTLLSLVVRPATQYDSSPLRQGLFSGLARLESRVRRALKRTRRPTALLFEKEAATAQDNGFALFRHLLENPPSFDFRFVMDPDSSQWDRVEGHPRVVRKFSFAYWRLLASPSTFFLASDVRYHLAHLHAQPGLLDRFVYLRKHYFLQHGVTALKKVGLFNPRSAVFPDAIATAAAWEKDALCTAGVAEAQIDVTGFPRWDRLSQNDSPREERVSRLLFMPTWRDWLEGRDSDELLHTSYVQTIQNLLGSPQLHEILETHDLELGVLPHPKLQALSSALDARNPRIRLLHQDEVDFTDLIRRTDLVITDYSSIVWDFVQAGKSAVLFQFDLPEYRGSMGMYETPRIIEILTRLRPAETQEELFARLDSVLDSDFAELRRANEAFAREVFPFHDGQNSSRVTREVENRLEQLSQPRVLPTYSVADRAYRAHVSRLHS